jgi:hypothetical protein
MQGQPKSGYPQWAGHIGFLRAGLVTKTADGATRMKARNKSQRRRSRTVYFPPKPKTEDGTPLIDRQAEAAELERAAYDQTKERRMTMHQVDDKFARSQECGHSIGRLLYALGDAGWFGRDKESQRQKIGELIAASVVYEEVHTAWLKIKGVPSPNPRAMDMNRIGGFSTDDLSQEQIDRINNRYMKMIGSGALGGMDKPGTYYVGLLRSAIMEDSELGNWHDPQVRDLIKALEVVAQC